MNYLTKITLITLVYLGSTEYSIAQESKRIQVTTSEEHEHAENEHGHDKEDGGKHAGEHDDEAADEHGHDKEDGDKHAGGHDDESGANQVKLSIKQMNMANIKVERLTPKVLDSTIYAPGEVQANGYTSYFVSPRVDSVVVKRHVALGERVKKGQALVTLFSETVAQTQAEFRKSSSEWKRVKKLGKKTVSGQRYVAAQADYESAYGQLIAFGLSEKAIKENSISLSKLGQYTLNAATSGAILTDQFHQGQRIESGQTLMEVADEQELWIEARLPANLQLNLAKGAKARVEVADKLFYGFVSQEAHVIDPVTRTRVVRLKVDNSSHQLHPGMFTNVYFDFKSTHPILAVPETALMRSSDGDWTVLVEIEKQTFKQVEVEIKGSYGSLREITGIKSNTKIVFQGAFYVVSEIAKGGFDPHNH